MAERFEINFTPNKVQKLFIESDADADLFSSRVGEGKSAALCWCTFHFTRLNPGMTWMIIRDTWENLRDTTFEEFLKWFPLGVCGDWEAGKKTYTWKLPFMHNFIGSPKYGKVKFIGLDDPGDVTKLQSRAIDGFAFEEPAPSEGNGGIPEEIFDAAFGRARDKNMTSFPVKLAQNNPDEKHWTYRRFVKPGEPGFKAWQTQLPENTDNLREGYYEKLRVRWAHRPDYVKRFVDGEYGFSPKGISVTPEFSEKAHLAHGLTAFSGRQLIMLWDFGLNPTCLITQISPMGHWNFIHGWCGDGIGVEELIENQVRPTMNRLGYDDLEVLHVGDPNGKMREQSSSKRSAVKSIRSMIGGRWKDGPIQWLERLEPAKAILNRMVSGMGLVQIDADKCECLHLALRGGWHYHKARTGVVSDQPVKDINSHPADCFTYGAAILYPISGRKKDVDLSGGSVIYQPWGGKRIITSGLGFERPYVKIPVHGQKL